MNEKKCAVIDYVNWRGEERQRRIIPVSIRFGHTEWHPDDQWLLKAVDIEDKDQTVKEFALRDIKVWK